MTLRSCQQGVGLREAFDVGAAGACLGGLARAGLVAALVALGGCVTAPAPDDAAADEANDPYEDLNRGVFAFNQTLDGLILKPAAQIYRGIVPEQGRIGIRNALANAASTVTFANDILQGDMDRATVTLGRLFINTLFGFGGLVDTASAWGAEPAHSEDFGQTLAVWGAEEGPYLMLPIFGPSNPRDAVGRLADAFTDPLNYVSLGTGAWAARAGTTAVDMRSRYLDQLDELERTSVDFYAAIRSLYRQRRDAEIRNGELSVEYLPAIEDFDE
jgi:phospholipid-binding lipoprotein MlaA